MHAQLRTPELDNTDHIGDTRSPPTDRSTYGPTQPATSHRHLQGGEQSERKSQGQITVEVKICTQMVGEGTTTPDNIRELCGEGTHRCMVLRVLHAFS